MAPSLQGPPITSRYFRFGSLQIDQQRQRLVRDGNQLPLQGKTFEVLIVLLQKQGEVATREELKRALWSTETHVNYDANLNTTISVAEGARFTHDYVNRTRANSPALYYLETRNWKAAEALRPDSSAETYNQAIIYWAQAVAAGHLRDLTTAEHAVTQYNALVEATKQGPRSYRAKYMAAKGDEAHAWLSFLQGKDKEAIELLQAVADEQDAEGKGEIELPAREMLADMFVEMNRPEDALAEFEKSMKVDPNRFNGLYGAGRAAELAGQQDKMRSYYGRLLGNCFPAQGKRPELALARDGMFENRRTASH